MEIRKKEQAQKIFQEFPFLEEIIEKDFEGARIPFEEVSCREFSVRKIDRNLLSFIPGETRWTGSLVDEHAIDRVTFILPGRILYDAVERAGLCGSNYAYSRREEWEGETVADAIDRLRIDPTQISFIVVSSRNWDDTQGRELEDEYLVTVYRPKADTVKTIKKIIRRNRFKRLRDVEREVRK